MSTYLSHSHPSLSRAPGSGASGSRASITPALALAALTLASAGCYSYQPVTQARLAPQQEVRLQLTAVAVDRLRNGANEERRLLQDFTVSGQVVSVSADSIVVSVPTTTVSDAGTRAVTFRQPLPLARSEMQHVELRTLDRKRTTIASIVVGGLAIAAAVIAIERGGEASGTTPPIGGPNEIRIPLLLRVR